MQEQNNDMRNSDGRWSNEKIRQIRGLMVFAAVLILLVIYSNTIYGGALMILKIFEPFLLGGAIAFVLNLPMKWIEEKPLKRWNGKSAKKCKRLTSIVGALLFLVFVIAMVVRIVIPQLSQAVTRLISVIPVFIENMVGVLERYSQEYPELKAQAEQLQNLDINWESVVGSVAGFLKNGVGSMLTSTFSVAGSIIGGLANLLISFIFAIYILSQKEKLGDQGRRVVTAYLPRKLSEKFLRVMSMLHRNFSNFIAGQCLEAVILGSMFVVAMTIFKMPYALMIGVLIAFTALIPVVGAFIGCAVGAFLILIENPVTALWFVILFLILQQLEGNLIYPKVVGDSVGLPSIWVLLAVSLGGSLFGVAGMLLFIPLLATVYTLFRESVNARNGVPVQVTPPVSQEVPTQNSTSQPTGNRRRKGRKPGK